MQPPTISPSSLPPKNPAVPSTVPTINQYVAAYQSVVQPTSAQTSQVHQPNTATMAIQPQNQVPGFVAGNSITPNVSNDQTEDDDVFDSDDDPDAYEFDTDEEPSAPASAPVTMASYIASARNAQILANQPQRDPAHAGPIHISIDVSVTIEGDGNTIILPENGQTSVGSPIGLTASNTAVTQAQPQMPSPPRSGTYPPQAHFTGPMSSRAGFAGNVPTQTASPPSTLPVPSSNQNTIASTLVSALRAAGVISPMQSMATLAEANSSTTTNVFGRVNAIKIKVNHGVNIKGSKNLITRVANGAGMKTVPKADNSTAEGQGPGRGNSDEQLNRNLNGQSNAGQDMSKKRVAIGEVPAGRLSPRKRKAESDLGDLPVPKKL